MDNAGRLSRGAGGWLSLSGLSSARGRIIVGFGFLVLILVAVAAGSAWQVRKHQALSAAMAEHANTAFVLQDGLVNVEEAASDLQYYVYAIYDVGNVSQVIGDEAMVAEIRADTAGVEQNLVQALAHAEMRDDREQAGRLYQLSAEADSLIAGTEMIIALRQSGEVQAAATALEVTVLPYREFEDKLKAAAEAEIQAVSSLQNQVDTAGDIALWLLVISGATGAVLGLAISAFVARSIIGPLSSLEKTAIAISRGDLQARSRATGPRELANLGLALNQMTDSLLDASRRRELEEMVQKFALLVQNSDDFIAMSSLEGNLEFVNNAGRELVGLHQDEPVTSKTLADFLTEEALKQWQDIEVPAVTENGHWSGESALRHFLTGETIPVHINSFLIKDPQSGNPVALATVQRDITERKRADEALRESERFLLESQSVAHIGSYVLDIPSGVWESSPVLDRIFGIGEDYERSVEGWNALVHPDVRQSMVDYFAHDVVEQRGHFDREYRVVRHDDGVERWVLGLGKLEFDARGRPLRMIGTIQDITERKQVEETIRHLAYHDALTKLPNRALFQDRLEIALAQARRGGRLLAVLYLDLDRFKAVNDSVGHKAGDELLQIVGERLSAVVRDGDSAARVGGDEFTLLLSEVTGKEDAVKVAERTLEAFRRPFLFGNHTFDVTTSIGIAMFPSDGEDAESLLRNADEAMYRAKDNGGDRYLLCTKAMNAGITKRLAVEEALRRGLERQEFMVYYQPQVEIDTERIVGTEALVRWQHPERGLLLPADFISVAEETGMIVPLGEWVLRTACAQNAAWQEAGLPPMRIGVNLSARQFQQRNLVEVVSGALLDGRLDPRYLQLEITEGSAMQDVEFAIAMLTDLRKMGVQISIDDFGSGYSSLNYLKRFPISSVKIDQSFVRDLTTDPSDAAIASTIIAMAHALKLTVIAEGVETEEQLAFLRERRCNEFQGYYCAKPLPADKLEELLRKRALARNVPSIRT